MPPPTQLSAVQPSPKRKRESAPPVPLLKTNLHTASTPPAGSPEPDSPRNVVANQLQAMTIKAGNAIPIPLPPLTPTDTAVRKKPKLDAMEEDPLEEQLEDSEIVSLDKEAIYRAFRLPQNDSAREIPETPQPDARTQTPRTFESTDVAKLPQPVVFTASKQQHPPKESSNDLEPKPKRSSQTRARKKSPSPPLTSLTWQDSEITGHLVDPTVDPDDDGTGINGIGFKPTPAIAYARQQKRRAQVREWNRRETMEARARRNERRRRGVGGTASREGTVEREMPRHEATVARRAVRFAMPTEG